MRKTVRVISIVQLTVMVAAIAVAWYFLHEAFNEDYGGNNDPFVAAAVIMTYYALYLARFATAIASVLCIFSAVMLVICAFRMIPPENTPLPELHKNTMIWLGVTNVIFDLFILCIVAGLYTPLLAVLIKMFVMSFIVSTGMLIECAVQRHRMRRIQRLEKAPDSD